MLFSFFKKKETTSDTTILFGTHSGNSKYIARELSKVLTAQGIANRTMDMGRYNAQELAREKRVLIVVSTHGEGEPPLAAQRFCKALQTMESLPNLLFSVCALGDSSYDLFCETGRQIDQRLEQLGATRLAERADCDVDFAISAGRWISDVCKKLQKGTPSEVNLNSNQSALTATLTKRERLSGTTSSKEVYHLEFEFNGPKVSYQPGDTFGFKPTHAKTSHPRYYSVASSPLLVPSGFHLTVKTQPGGLCSPHLNEQIAEGDTMQFTHKPSVFRLTGNDSSPLLLIANGVGVAPFRGFLQQVEKMAPTRKVWLIYGDRNPESDFLYAREWETWIQNGQLTQLDVVFSKGTNPRYVQDVLQNRAEEIAQWIDQHAQIYVCGSVPMGAGVRQQLSNLIEKHATKRSNFDELIQNNQYYEEIY